MDLYKEAGSQRFKSPTSIQQMDIIPYSQLIVTQIRMF
ncbi:hypothetical protein BSM4216_2850 [Bacillus smithii]|nr:hypothetical protein BSM4216_2850 [Bacillus smithii]